MRYMAIDFPFFKRRGHRTTIALIVVVMLALWVFLHH